MARRSEHTKEQLQSIIVDMGEKIISENGLKALTARRLSQNIGYTVGTLYNKFSNLDQIILHVNAKTLDKMIPVLNIASAGGVIPLAIAYLEFSQQHRNVWYALFDFQTRHDYQLPKWLTEKIQKLFNLLIGTLQKHEGLSDVSLIDAEALWAGVHGICVLANNGKVGVIHESVPKNLLTVYIHTFLSGLSKIRDGNLVEKFSE